MRAALSILWIATIAGVVSAALPQQGGTAEATIAGRVTDGSTGRGVPNARVQITGPGGMTVLSTAKSGRFPSRTIPPGDYEIRVTATGFLPATAGQVSPGDFARPMRVGPGSSLDLTIPAWRPSVVEGKVVDEDGRPVVGAQVSVIERPHPERGAELLTTGGTDVTDDRGAYRIAGLVPAEYAITVAFTYGATSGSLEELPPSAKAQRGSAPQVQGSAAYQSTICSGKGLYHAVHAGQTYKAGSCVVPELSHRPVSVLVVQSGQPARNAAVAVAAPAGRALDERTPVLIFGRTDANGEIVLPVFPRSGALVSAWTDGPVQVDPQSWPGDLLPGEPPPRVTRAGPMTAWAERFVRFEESTSGVRLELGGWPSLRVRTQRRDDAGTATSDASDATVSSVLTCGTAAATVSDTRRLGDAGHLLITGPGLCALTVIPPAGWQLERIALDGQPVAARVAAGRLQGAGELQVSLTNARTGLSVVLDQSRSDEAVQVFLIPQGPVDATSDLVRASPMLLGRSGNRFVSRLLPSGDCVVTAVLDPRFDITWTSQEIIETLSRAGTRVHLNTGDHPTISLRARPVHAGRSR